LPFLLIGLAWLVAAIALSVLGVIAKLEPPAPQLMLAGLTVALVLAYRFLAPFREWLLALDWRVIVAFHLTRFIGFYFLALYRRGELPYAFAVEGGTGDIIVAALAVLLLATSYTVDRRPHLLAAWNVLGLADILFVVVTATRLALADPASMAPLLHLPLSLLITFFVPLIIASHLLVFVRLSRWPRPA